MKKEQEWIICWGAMLARCLSHILVCPWELQGPPFTSWRLWWIALSAVCLHLPVCLTRVVACNLFSPCCAPCQYIFCVLFHFQRALFSSLRGSCDSACGGVIQIT